MSHEDTVASQSAELGDNVTGEYHNVHGEDHTMPSPHAPPAADDWQELGDEVPPAVVPAESTGQEEAAEEQPAEEHHHHHEQPAEEHHHHEQPAEEHHHHQEEPREAVEEAEALRAEEEYPAEEQPVEEEPAEDQAAEEQPAEDQWAELGDEQPAEEHHHHEQPAEEAEALRAEEEYPAEEQPAAAHHHHEQPAEHHHHEQPAEEHHHHQEEPREAVEEAEALRAEEEYPAEEQPVEEEPAEDQAAEEQPAEDQWAELGDEQPAAAHHHHEQPAEHHHHEQPAEEHHHHQEEPREAVEEAEALRAEEEYPAEEQPVEEEPAEDQAAEEQPAEDQWAELGDEQPAAAHHHHEQPAEEAEALRAEEEYPAEEQPAAAHHHHEQPAEHHHHEQPAEEHHHHQEEPREAVEEAEALRAEEEYPAEEQPVEEEPAEDQAAEEQPAEDQWAELGDEQPAAAHHHHEQPAEEAEALRAEEEYPAEEHHHHEQPAEHHHHEQPAEEHHHHQEEPREAVEEAEALRAEEEYPAEEQPVEEEPAEDQAAEEQPAEDQWAELGDEQPAAAHHHHEQPAEHHHHEQPAEEHHHHQDEPREAVEEAEALCAEEEYPAEEQPVEEEPAEDQAAEEQPAEDQWAELGDEQPAAAHHHHEQPAEHHHHEQPAAAHHHHEQPAEHHQQARSVPPPVGGIVKPRTSSGKSVARWEPVEHEVRDDSDDEFELSTCMAPVYEGEGEAGSEEAGVFKHGGPDCEGEVMSCFEEPNLLYRVINPKEKTWAFYNDSLNYEMHVQFTFGKHSKLQPLENTVMNQNEDGQFVTEVVVYPTETEMFVQGSVNGFTSKLRAVPLSDEYHNSRRGVTEEQVAGETAAIQQLTDSDNAEDVLQVCIENGVPFVDPEFPPCQASLEAGATKPFKPFAWARPQACVPEEMASQVRLFRSKVKPGCVDAGDLGDSWVMCSVAAVSEDPARLMGMFRHPEGKAAAQREHAVGAYRVTFNKNGWWRSVLVDSYLPVSAGKLKYAKSAVDPAEIWPAILEKAYAKLHGSYAKICSGDPLHALQDMTGFSTTRFDEALSDSKDSTQLFDDLVRGIAAGYTVICSTPGRGLNDKDQELSERYASVGLVTGHAYTILDAKYVEQENLRLVKVRNAWGRGVEWNGDWGDNDSKWEQYPEVADACGFVKADDGTFWMPWEAAQKYFNGGGVCFSHMPAYDYRMNSVFTSGVPSAVLEIEVSSPTWFTFVISQDDKRCQENVTEYQPVMLSIAEPVDGGMFKVVMNSSANGARPSSDKWTFLQARDISLIHKLNAGKYIVIPRLMPSEGQAEQVPYVLGMITNKEVGSGDVTVKFKRLDAGNRIFENFPKFEPELLEVEPPVQFQKRAPGEGFPMTQMGEELV